MHGVYAALALGMGSRSGSSKSSMIHRVCADPPQTATSIVNNSDTATLHDDGNAAVEQQEQDPVSRFEDLVDWGNVPKPAGW